jgi:class 3 adenylate cyclase
MATLELALEDSLSLLKVLVFQAGIASTKSAGVADTGSLELTQLQPGAHLEQLIVEQACLGQVSQAVYELSQCLLAIVWPFLSRHTWIEAIEVARCGGCALPTKTRQASILWLDIASFTELMGRHGLDEVVSALSAYLGMLTQLIYRHRGDVDKYGGDGFLSVFGTADDAVEAACAIQQAAASFNRRQSAWGGLVFPTRIAIDTGQITTISLGSRDRQDRTVLGAPVNLAKRLQEKATPGKVWLSQATFDRLCDQSGCCCLSPVKVKGRQEPIVVYEKH